MVEVNREMQKRNLAALAKSPGGFQFTKTFFPYTSSEIGPYYVQSAAIMANGPAYSVACNDMATLVKEAVGEGFEGVVSGGESRDWCFSGPVAEILKLAHIMIYKTDETGKCKTVGADIKDKKVIHVADLNNEGSSPRDMWIPTIRGAGGEVGDIFFYVDRLESGVEEMKKLGLQPHAIIPLDGEAWKYLQEINVVTPEIYESLCKRLEDKDAWAKNMLRSEEGLETLVALLASGKTREKGQKILSVGYPEIKDEIIDMLKSDSRKSKWPGVERWLK
jgi:orotate phosphoribosyltransferase